MIHDCDNCKHAETPAFFEPCASCGGSSYWEPYVCTNYERIVSQTPEEFAVWLAQQEYRRPRFDGWLPLCNHVMGPRTCHKDGCEKCWLDWMKEKAKEGD